LHRAFDGGAVEALRDAVGGAKEILYLGDNSGEIVFDRLLIEQLPGEKVTFVVKAGPILNDALVEDTEEVGLADMVEVIDNGDDAPGTILERCSEDFRRRFAGADVVIAKGQGNYETLSDVDRDVFFMLQAKCEVIARHFGCEKGTPILSHYRAGSVDDEVLSERG
jgi:uncharacterized protein with ATP-grasp and redox domains